MKRFQIPGWLVLILMTAALAVAAPSKSSLARFPTRLDRTKRATVTASMA